MITIVIASCNTPNPLIVVKPEIKNECRKIVDHCATISENDGISARYCMVSYGICEKDPKMEGFKTPHYTKQWEKHYNLGRSLIMPTKYWKGNCEKELKWGFEKIKKESDPFKMLTLINRDINYTNLIGKYDTEDKCEEHRLLTNEKWYTKTCVRRYVGKKLEHPVFKIMVMDGTRDGTSLYFENKIKCEQAEKLGYDYYSYMFSRFNYLKILPTGSKDYPRFIGNCKVALYKVCEPNEKFDTESAGYESRQDEVY